MFTFQPCRTITLLLFIFVSPCRTHIVERARANLIYIIIFISILYTTYDTAKIYLHPPLAKLSFTTPMVLKSHGICPVRYMSYFTYTPNCSYRRLDRVWTLLMWKIVEFKYNVIVYNVLFFLKYQNETCCQDIANASVYYRITVGNSC